MLRRPLPPLWLALLTAVACAPRAVVEAPAADTVGVAAPEVGMVATYLGNEGFLIEGGGHRVLIDALYGTGIPGYPVVPAPIREQLEAGAGLWGGVDLAIASHHHGDHFDAAAVARFLAANPQARFLSTPQAVDRLAAAVDDPAVLARAEGVLPATGETIERDVGGIGVTVLHLHHGLRDPPVENLGVVVRMGDHRFLHFGDTEATMEDFEPYLDRLAGTDLALLPFWFLSSEWRAQMVREQIRPPTVVAAHVPEATAPAGHFARWNSHRELVAAMRDAFPGAVIPAAAGDRIEVTAPAHR